MNVAAVLLDMDGLMVDTEPLYKIAWQQAAFDLGYDLNDTRYAMIVGRPIEDCERIVVEQFGPAFPLDRLREGRQAAWRREVDRVGVHPKPGLHELLAFATQHRLPVAVATSTTAAGAAFTLGRAGLADRFEVIVTGDQITRGKPAPDIYLECARRLGVAPEQCVGLEDSEAGIRSIASAGMVGILVPHWPASEAARAAAFRVVDTLHEARELIASLHDPVPVTE